MESDVLSAASRERSRAFLWLFLAWLAVRLPLLLSVPGASFDMESYSKVASSMLGGAPLYGNPELLGRYPYFPAWSLLLAALQYLSRCIGLAPALLFKLPGLLGDLACGYLIYLLAERLRLPMALSPQLGQEPFWMGRAFASALAWILNPLSFLISAGHGQFDSLALACLLLAAWYSEFSEAAAADTWSALSLGCGIALKSWPLFFLPLLMRLLPSLSERRRYAALALGLPLLLLLPFLVFDGVLAVARAMAYSGATALSLPEALRGFFFAAGAPAASYAHVASLWRDLGLGALLLAWLWFFLSPRALPLFAGMAFATALLYVFAPGLSPQYLLWLLPWLLLLPGPYAWRFSLLASLMLTAFYVLFVPEALFPAGVWPGTEYPPLLYFVWALLNLGLWFYFSWECLNLWRLCRRHQGRLGLR